MKLPCRFVKIFGEKSLRRSSVDYVRLRGTAGVASPLPYSPPRGLHWVGEPLGAPVQASPLDGKGFERAGLGHALTKSPKRFRNRRRGRSQTGPCFPSFHTRSWKTVGATLAVARQGFPLEGGRLLADAQCAPLQHGEQRTGRAKPPAGSGILTPPASPPPGVPPSARGWPSPPGRAGSPGPGPSPPR